MTDDLRYRVHDATTTLTALARTPLWWMSPAWVRARLTETSTGLFEVETTVELAGLRDRIDRLAEATTGPPLLRAWRLFSRRGELSRVLEGLSRLDAELQARPRGAIPTLGQSGPRAERTRIPRQSAARNISAG